MDFTPGALVNCQPERYGASWTNLACKSTRANQLAMYVLFETMLRRFHQSLNMACLIYCHWKYMQLIKSRTESMFLLPRWIRGYMLLITDNKIDNTVSMGSFAYLSYRDFNVLQHSEMFLSAEVLIFQ